MIGRRKAKSPLLLEIAHLKLEIADLLKTKLVDNISFHYLNFGDVTV